MLQPFYRIFEVNISRRRALAQFRDIGALSIVGAAIGNGWVSHLALASPASPLSFDEPNRKIGPADEVARGYRADILIRWGDPISENAALFDPHNLRAGDQERQFGYNNDFIAYMPLPKESKHSNHGLLCVNHEYTDATLMWPSADTLDGGHSPPTQVEQVAYEMAAHGHSVVEIVKAHGRWHVAMDSIYARRIDAKTPMTVSGPAAGHARLQTKADPSGRQVLGTINSCAGGKTPWGTVLIAEENFDGYFGGTPTGTIQETHYRQYGIEGNPRYSWHLSESRFDINREPNESNRFGWVVELDPYNASSIPIKRTALGRFKHEGAAVWVDNALTVVVYSGDDESFQYLYRFVARHPYDPGGSNSNRDLLDDGVLSVARFDNDGTLEWLPIVHGMGPLTEGNGFSDMGEVLIETRRAATLLGATPLDRPEDAEVNPKNGLVYVAFTNNKQRNASQINAISPRAPNLYGGIVELVPPENGFGADHAASRYRWRFLLQGGNPSVSDHGARYHSNTSHAGWFAAPDNVAFDPAGRLWIATDQGTYQHFNGIPDGLYACEVEGDTRT